MVRTQYNLYRKGIDFIFATVEAYGRKEAVEKLICHCGHYIKEDNRKAYQNLEVSECTLKSYAGPTYIVRGA